MEITPIEIIQTVYQPYELVWDEWKSSPACFLNRKTIIVFENYLKTGNLESSCRKFRIDETEAERILYTAIIILNIKLPIFEEWLLKRFSNNSVFWFTHAPIEKLPLNNNLKKKLKELGEPNLNSIFKKYSLKDLKRKWGRHEINEFKIKLKYYQCSDLLEEKNNAK